MTDEHNEIFETNSIIRASAGTGKTYALATRFIRLMLIDGVKPETIVALTFSRAAAQEIYTKILDRLCKAAKEGLDKNGKTFAENEWNGLLEDYRNGEIANGRDKLKAILAKPPPHEAHDFAILLRKLVDTQHLGAIATLDSFILKIVRNFPKEMGVQNAVSVLDPIDEDSAVDDAVTNALVKTNGTGADIAAAFVRAQKGEYPRQCLGTIGGILAQQGWRNFVLSHPECIQPGSRWTVESMAAKLGVELESTCPDLSMIPFNEIHRAGSISHEESFVNWARSYDGTKSPVEIKNPVVALMRHFWDNPRAESYSYTFYRRMYTVSCGKEGAAAIRGAISHMMNVYLKRQLEIVEAKIRLVEAVETEYERATRRMGKLTFTDFTKYSAEEEFSNRGIALKNIEFRFDSKFDHWALDEFQDTSELQWRCLKELVRDAAAEGRMGGNRTAMVVGDMKQSIYTWRGASERPFEDIGSWQEFTGFERDLSLSHRYGPNIANFVNRVFGPDNIQVGDTIPPVCEKAVAAWRNGWRDHVSKEAPDYVKVVAAAGSGEDEGDDAMLSALCAEVKQLWDRHRDAKSADTVGILVRSNDQGLAVADCLRKNKIGDVVWEGMSPCADDPVVQSVLALLKLADHPSDSAAWKTVSELIDVCAVVLPECKSCADASLAVSRLLTQQGLSRTLKDWCAKLRASGHFEADGPIGEKLGSLVELAVAFENRKTGDGGMLAFADFAAKNGKREISASPDAIRILTIHRSKGLGFDHVFVPLFEKKRSQSAIDAPKSSTPLFVDKGEWVLSHLKKGSEQFNKQTKAAYEWMRNERFAESLRTYYVALTRAKKSMVVLVSDEENASDDTAQGLLVSDLIRNAVGGVLPYEVGTLPPFKAKGEKDTRRSHEKWPDGSTQIRIERVTPSQSATGAGGGQNAADLFDSDFGDAAQRGIAAHAEYAAIEWIDSAAPRTEREAAILANGFRAAFVKPEPGATVWRERSYELLEGSRWETGQFDRVVFTGAGDNVSAVIYDFKTNRKRAGEGENAFAERMRGVYSAQMNAYRKALHRLTQIPLERIEARLLLEATGQSVAV